MEKRIGVVGIVIDDPKQSAPRINEILTNFGHIIMGRMGLPHSASGHSVIALTVEGTTDQIGALTGQLGQLPDVTVKSAVAR